MFTFCKAGQDGKKRKENHTTKVTKIPKTKRQKYGMNETLDTNFFSGSNRTVIVDTNLEAPMGLALDLKRHRLFWCDSALTTLNSVNFDGADRHSLMESESRKWLSKPMGVTFFEGHLYWIDVTFNGGSISKVSTIQTDRAPELLADHLTDIYDLKIYSSRAQKGKLYTSFSFKVHIF